MPFEPGHKLATGRPKGSSSQRTKHFHEVLEARGFDLPEALVDIYAEAIKFYEYSKTDPVAGPPALRLVLDAVKEIGSYSQPKLKAVEHKATNPLDGLTQAEKLQIMKEAVVLLEQEVGDVTIEPNDQP